MVDDQLSVRSTLGKVFTGAGYAVILAAPGAEATRVSGGGSFQQVNAAAKRLGAVATIAKPFDNQTMIDLVAHSLAGAP